VVLSTAPLVGQPAILVRETLRAAWRHAGLAEQAMTSRHWRQLAEFALSAGAAPLNLPGDVRAVREGELLVLRAAR
jgi:hypothetical protein